jgi:hypothetical protein
LATRRGRALVIATAVVVCFVAVGIAVALSSDDAKRSAAPLSPPRAPRFNVLPVSIASRNHVAIVQVDADRAVVFGGMTWDKQRISVANDGALIDFASRTSTPLAGPKLDDGLVRMRAVASGTKVLFFGMECASGRLPATFDGEGDVADPCIDAPLTLTTLDVATGAWSDPLAAPAFVGGNVRWVVDAWVVGHTTVIEWFESDRDSETFTAYDIPSGTWRALDSPPGPLQGSCATHAGVVGVTYKDTPAAGGPPPPQPRLLLLDPSSGTWKSVVVPELFGPAVGGVVCVANRPVVYGNPAPSFASVLFTYSPAEATWQLVPAAPESLLAGRFVVADDVLVGWRAPSGPTTPSLSFQTIDLAQPKPQWSSNATAATPASAEFATGVHTGEVVIARVDDTLHRVAIAQ